MKILVPVDLYFIVSVCYYFIFFKVNLLSPHFSWHQSKNYKYEHTSLKNYVIY